MDIDFIGRHVSIYCGPSLGYFQGQIKSVNVSGQTLCIENPYKNGVKCDFPEITLSSQDIIDLTLIDNLPSSLHGKHKIKKPSTVNAPSSSKTKNNVTNKYSTTQSSKSTEKNSVTNESNSVQQQSPPRLTHSFKELRRSHVKDGRPFNLGYNSSRMGSFRNQDDCFNVDCNEFTEDFDFEKNLALFDKQALYEEVFSGSDGEIRTPIKSRKGKVVAKYRHDENVLESQPTIYRQIVLTNSIKSEVTEYYTDSGLVIPCITADLHRKICSTAIELGINVTRQIEVFGINSSQMALNLLGGTNRLHPRNTHQCPHVVIFTGPHQVGAQGIATARHLANQNVQVEVFLANFVKMNESLQEELKLLSLTNARLVNDVKDLSSSPVDLVITAIDDDQSSFLRTQAWYTSVTKWCTSTIAPIMCLCPLEDRSSQAGVNVRWSVCSVLPRSLSPSYGSIYLVDLGLPEKVFRRLGIKYRSPFCAKPFIALHTSR